MADDVVKVTVHPWPPIHTHTCAHPNNSILRPSCSCTVHRVKINVTAEPYCALPPFSISFIHKRVIGSQFELPLCLLWANFGLTECGRLMATSSQGRLASASMSALNSLHQFPPVLSSPTSTHKREKGGSTSMKGNKSKIVRWRWWKTKKRWRNKEINDVGSVFFWAHMQIVWHCGVNKESWLVLE